MYAKHTLTSLSVFLFCAPFSYSAQTLRYDGIENSSLGAAQISVGANDALVVSNIGSSGLDGVRVELGAGQGTSLDPMLQLGPNGSCVISAQVRREGAPQASPVSINIVSDGTNTGAFYTPDFSSIGLQTYTLRLSQAGQIVYQESGQTGGTKMQQGGGLTSLPQTAYMTVMPFGPWGGAYLECFTGGGIIVTPPGGNPIAADMIEFLSDPAQIVGTNAVQITAADVSGTLEISNEQLRSNDRFLVARDSGWLDALPGGRLKVSNLGSSGCDGVSIALPDDTDEAEGEMVELAASMNPNGEVRLESKCGSGEIDRLFVRDFGGQWGFTPNFSALGANTYTLELYDQGQLVFAQSGMSGPAVTTAAWALFYKKTTEHPDGTVTTEWCIGGGTSRAHSVVNGPTVLADMFTVRSTPISVADDDLTAINLLGGNLGVDLELLAIDPMVPCVGTSYCITAPNSAGPGAAMCSSGSSSIAANDLVLTCTGLPANQFGLFVNGTARAQNPIGNGFLCVGGQLFRLALTSSDAAGFTSLAYDNTAPPQPSGQVSAGQTWHFTYWHRDIVGAGYNLSNGHTIVFTP